MNLLSFSARSDVTADEGKYALLSQKFLILLDYFVTVTYKVVEMLHPLPPYMPFFFCHRLANCSLSEQCWDYLSEVLRRNKTLNHLDISSNDLKDEGLKVLCGALSLPDSVLISLR